MSRSPSPSLTLSATTKERPWTFPRNPHYYFEDGNIVFLVQCQLFRIHRFFLVRESALFRDMLSLPPQDGNIEGVFDDRPIKLDQVKSVDFARLLWIFYNPSYIEYNSTIDVWTSILGLADKWEMDIIRKIAVNALDHLPDDPLKKIALYSRFALEKEWALKAFIIICKRAEPLTLEEAAELGLDMSMRISRAREKLVSEKCKLRGSCRSEGDLDKKIHNIVRVEIFDYKVSPEDA